MADINALAQAHVESYAAAAALGRKPNASIPEVAAAYAKHYHLRWTSFTHGQVTPFDAREACKGSIVWLLEHYRAGGLGIDVRLEASRIEKISDTSAICWVKWMLVPPQKGQDSTEVEGDGKNAVRFEDVYGFRLGKNDGLEGGWEYVIADQEMTAVVTAVPTILGEGWADTSKK